MIGKTISHYVILEKIGEGSMGKVYLAMDTVLNREVALKFLPTDLSRDPIAKERFFSEARAASILDHSNVCVIHEISETDDGQLFISMNYYKGETLREKIKNKQLTIKKSINFITQIASGLESAHKKDIVHCDIKPSNILITVDGTLKIVDFGIAKVCSEAKLVEREGSSSSIAYMSPEQVSNSNITPRSDIWSLGVVFYELLTSQRPFTAKDNEALTYSIINEEPQSIILLNPKVHPRLEKIVQKMLNKNPDKRFQSLGDLLKEINNFKKIDSHLSSDNNNRNLAAIMFTDMVGYSALTQRNEVLALELLEEHRQILRPFIPKHKGHEIETAGDAFFIEFSSALEAVTCAIEIQKAFWKRNISVSESKHIKIRIGIHLGDVVHRGDNVLGDGVNITARIEPLALSGGICVSEDVARQVQNKIEFPLQRIETKHLKNIVLPVKVYAIMLPWLDEIQYSQFLKKRKKIVLSLVTVFSIILLTLVGVKIPDLELFNKSNVLENSEWQNSIAVLPFSSLDRTEESEIFSDGIHEDILSHIAKIRNIKVIARTSVLQYKDTRRSLREIGQELGVKTILEGSVRKYGNKVRVVAQLIDADTEGHIWTETYNQDYTDIFAIQSDIATKIAEALKTKLTNAEKQAINEIPTVNLKAYEFYQKGINLIGKGFILENYLSAISIFEKAIDLDDDFVSAYSLLCKSHLMVYWYNEQIPKEHLKKAEIALNKAQKIDPEHSSVYVAEGYYYYYGMRNYGKALDKFQLALNSYPNDSDLLAAIGYVLRRQGNFFEALEYLKRATAIDPISSNKAHETGKTARSLRKWTDAEHYLIKATSISPQNSWAYLDRIEIAIEKNGDLLESRKILEDALLHNDSTKMIWARVFVEYMDRNYQKTLDILNENKITNITQNSKLLFDKGRVALAMNNVELATSYFNSLKLLGLSGKRKFPKDWIYLDYLYKAYAGMGMQKEFTIEYELLETLMPFQKDILVGLDRTIQKIECLIWLGEYNDAINLIYQMLSKPNHLTINRLNLSPIYDPIRNNPKFIELLKRHSD